MAVIQLEDLRFYAHHGVSKKERALGGQYKVDVCIRYDSKKVEKTDNIKNGLDYEEIYAVVEKCMKKSTSTLEKLGRKMISKMNFSLSIVADISIKITKLNPPITGMSGKVSVTIYSNEAGKFL